MVSYNLFKHVGAILGGCAYTEEGVPITREGVPTRREGRLCTLRPVGMLWSWGVSLLASKVLTLKRTLIWQASRQIFLFGIDTFEV